MKNYKAMVLAVLAVAFSLSQIFFPASAEARRRARAANIEVRAGDTIYDTDGVSVTIHAGPDTVQVEQVELGGLIELN